MALCRQFQTAEAWAALPWSLPHHKGRVPCCDAPVFHVGLLRPFVASPARFSEPRAAPAAPILLDNTDERYYTVEAFRASRRVRLGTKHRWTNKFLVKWTGYGESENTWEDATKLREDVPGMIEEFLAARK